MFIFLNEFKQVKRIKSILFVLAVLISFSFANSVFGWTAPTAIPPGNNVDTPLNIGATEQTKEGSLIIIGSAIFSGGVDLSYGGVNESDITGADQIIGYNDLRLWGNSSETESIWIDSDGAKIVFKVNNAERMRINSSGYVGIATSTPAYTLDVAGDINLTGNLTQNGSAFTAGNYWSKSGSYVYYNDGNVGIGTATPGYKLEVSGDFRASATSTFADGSYFNTSGLTMAANKNIVLSGTGKMGIGASPDASYKLTLSGGGIKSGSTDQPAGYFTSSSGYGLLVDAGNVGIGTLTPTYKLDVSGDFRASATSTFTGNVGIGTATPAYKLEVVGNTNIQGDLTINGSPIATGYWSKSGSYVYYNDGNVGIGTATPGYKLEVSGDFRASATSTFADGSYFNTSGLTMATNKNIVLSGTGTISGASSISATSFVGALTGNASTATALETARTIGGVSFDGTADIVPTTIVVADTTDTTSYVGLWESATGNLLPKTDAGITYNAGTGILTAAGFTGTDLTIDTNTLYVDSANNRVGIATSTPAYTLDVAGDINLTGNLTIDGSVISTGYWSKSGSYVYYNDGNVGIGTATPGAKLEIYTSDDDAVQYGLKINSNDNFQPSINYGVYSNANMTSFVNSNIYGGYFIGEMGRGTNSSGSQIGLVGEVKITDNIGEKTIPTETVGVKGITTVDSAGSDIVNEANSFKAAGSVASGDTITSYKGYRVTDVTGAGTTTNSYGLYVDSLTKGSSNNYAIYTAGTTESYFGGNVGIGTDSPGQKLEVSGVDAGIAIGNRWDGSTAYSGYIGKPATAGGLGADGSAYIKFADDLATGVRKGTNIDFYTHNYSGGTNHVMSIVGDGYVGIGTDSPEAAVDINKGTADVQVDWSSNTLPYGTEKADLILTRRHSASADSGLGRAASMIDFRSTNSSYEWSVAQIVSSVDPSGGSGYQGGLSFLTSGGGTDDPAGRRDKGAAPTVRMVINADGNVGIGTTSPDYKLEVNGGVLATRFYGPLDVSNLENLPSNSDLEVYLPFNGSIHDAAGNYSTSYVGTLSFEAGIDGSALLGNNTNKYISLGATKTFASSDSWTIAFWHKEDVDNGSFRFLAGTGGNADGIGIANTDKVFIRFSDAIYAYGDTITRADLHHLVYVYSNGSIAFYIDGEEAGTASHSQTFNLSLVGKGYSNYYLDGWMDDFRVYNIAINADQAKALYEAQGRAGSIRMALGGISDAALQVDETGSVGIGTTSPDLKLDIVHSDAGGSAAYAVKLRNEVVSNTAVTGIAFNIRGDIEDRGYGGIVYEGDGSGGPGDFHFLQKTVIGDGLPALSDAVVTILNDGNVGIGTTSPLHKLVIGNVSSNPGSVDANDILAINAGKDTYKGILISGGGYTNVGGEIRVYWDDADTDDVWLSLGTRGFGGVANVLNIRDGNVGIGTVNPAYTLDVAGDINLTGNLTKNGSAVIEALAYFFHSHTTSVTPEWCYIGSLPLSSGGTYDQIHVEILGQDWTVDSVRSVYFFRNRSGFSYEWYYEGDMWSVARPLIAVYDVDGRKDIYVKNNESYTRFQLRAILLGGNINKSNDVNKTMILGKENIPDTWVTTTPTGTLVFDASNLGTYPPNMFKRLGSMQLSGKLTVPTIDPQYDINGNTYGYYISDYAGGVRMNVTGKAELKKSIHIINFDDLEEGSELWLFAQKTDLGEEMDNLIVLLTSEGEKASLWYEIIHSKNQLIVHGDKDVKFSYRLSAPRYDWRDHPVLMGPSD